MSKIDEKALEAAAKAVFECHCFNPDNHPWVEGGNSFKQQDARRLALAAIEASRAALPPPGDVGELGKPHMLDPKTPVTHEEAFEIAKRFIDYRFGNENEVPRASIPCDLERDDDVRLHAYIRQNARLSARLAEVERLVQQREKELAATFCDDAKMKLLEKYNAQAERLAAALRPFALAAEAFPVNANPRREKNNVEAIIWSYQRNYDGSEKRLEITVPHLRAAAEALSDSSASNNGER